MNTLEARRHALLARIAALPDDPVAWKDANGILESLPADEEVVAALLDVLPRVAPGDRVLVVQLLGMTRHPAAGRWLAARFFEGALDGPYESWLTRALASAGGDEAYDRVLRWLDAPGAPALLPRMLDAVRCYDRPDGPLLLRALCERGVVAILEAALRIAPMSIETEAVLRWWEEGSEAARTLALEVAITRAGSRRDGVPAPHRATVQAMLDAPPRPLRQVERWRLEGWLAR